MYRKDAMIYILFKYVSNQVNFQDTLEGYNSENILN